MKTKALKQGKRGKRTMLPAEIDEKVLEMIRNKRNARVVINFHTVVGFATGIVLANDRTLLKENGGTVELIVGWCQSIFKRLNFVRRKSLIVKTLDSSWFDKRNWISFYKEIHELIKWFNIPKELVINIDQTPLPFVLVSSYTMDKKDNQCVSVAGTTEYLQIYIWCKPEWRFLANTTHFQGKTKEYSQGKIILKLNSSAYKKYEYGHLVCWYIKLTLFKRL